MELRGWKWKSPWEKRNYLLCILFYLILLLQGHRTVAEGGYSQELKNEIQDSTKLDSLSNYLPYDSKEDSDYKRASSFFPLRGKKFSSDDKIDHQLIFPEEEQDKRSQFFPLRGKKVPDDLKRASYFTPMRGRRDDGWMDDYDITDENPYKRASSFMPMRGKKRYEAISDYLTKAGTYSNDIDELLNSQNSNSYHSDDKRMSFVPVRGKRSSEESPDTQVSLKNDSKNETALKHLVKKRSVSFMPMRGKKDSADFKNDATGSIATTLLEKKEYSFMPMRGRREKENNDQISDLDKKAMFMPMRGRREDDDHIPDLDKKATFMPMRGRRENDDQISDLEKKATFMPMRGRRENNDQIEDLEKKATFMPMRGRRENDDKIPDLDKKATFMPMRGRRNNDEEIPDLEKKATFMPMRGRRENGDHISDFDKKATFMPMRGRRENDELVRNLDKKANFMPMRGRRENDESDSTNFQSESLLKRASYFMPMRGRRLMDIIHSNSDMSNIESNIIDDKRASSFMPMRGRRSVSEKNTHYDTYYYKRASSFMPMRGKRSTENLKTETHDSSLESSKRASVTQLRVRRSVDEDFKVDPWSADQLMSLLSKKSYSFMPMRGRRFYETNVTVEPWQADQLMSLFNKKSSFMPMRGRRFYETNVTIEPWQADQLMSLFNKKSSFMPMRGRRLEDGNFTVEPWPAEELMSLFNKKSSFLPMRGRRDYSEDMDYGGNVEKRGSYFMPMRGRRLVSKQMHFFRPYPYLSGIGSSLMYKPYSDIGTVVDISERRKKLKINWDAVKRAFHASRGKRSDFGRDIRRLIDKWYNKETTEQYEDSDKNDNNNQYSDMKIAKLIDTSKDSDRDEELCNLWWRLKREPEIDPGILEEFELGNNEFIHQCSEFLPGKRRKEDTEEETRVKRSVIRTRLSMQPNRQYIALKRPMSFFATRGKRMDDSAIDKISKLH